MKIIFCDTNIVFWLFKKIASGEEIEHSVLFEFAKKNEVIISDFVIEEAERNIFIKYNISLFKYHIQIFLEESNIKLTKSNILHGEALPYVNDLNDAQILQDAIDCDADYIVTKNISDFDIEEIYDKFGIKITRNLPIWA